MGSRCQEQEIVAVLGEPLRELVSLRSLDLVPPCGRVLRVGAALVSLVEDDEVPPLLPDPFPYVVLLGVVDGRDDLGFPLPKIQELMLVVRRVDDLERLVEKAEQLVLPLNGQRGRDEDEAPVDGLPELEFLDEEAGHDRFARARVVGEQEAQPGLWQHAHIDRLDLMGQSADAGQADRELAVISVGETDAGRLDQESQPFRICGLRLLVFPPPRKWRRPLRKRGRSPRVRHPAAGRGIRNRQTRPCRGT